MSNKIHGRCHCKKIKFSLNPPTEFCSHCHCDSCRRIHGAAFVTWTSVPDIQLKILSGEQLLKKYESSPGVFWLSCNHCSSPLFQKTNPAKGRTYIALSSLTDKLDRSPDCHVSYEEHVEWINVRDGLPQLKAKASDIID